MTLGVTAEKAAVMKLRLVRIVMGRVERACIRVV